MVPSFWLNFRNDVIPVQGSKQYALKEYRSSVVCMYYYGFRCWSRIFSLKDKKIDEDDHNDDDEDHGDEDGEKMTTSCRRRLSSFRKP